MRGEELLYRLEEIDPDYLNAAEKAHGYRVSRWLALGAAAACLALLGYAGVRLLLPGSEPAENQPALPLLSVAENFGGGMGFEGYMAYDISELVSANPWQEDMNLTSLPVYRNPVTYDETYHLPSGAAFDKMEALLRQTAGRLGLEDLVITDDSPDEETRAQIQSKMEGAGLTVPEEFFDPTRLLAQAGDTELQVDLHLTAEISFEPARPLPQEYSFTHYSTYKEIEAAAEYLRTQYGELLGMEEPRLNLYGGDYDIYGRQLYRLEFFEGAGSDLDQILHYNFTPVAFYCDDAGGLFLVRIWQPDLSQKMGDYPIITADQARELLLEGHYITTVPYEMPGREYIRKVELVYRTGTQEEYYMPYYRFYAELPQEKRENGLNTYGAYYVPAVSGEYLTGMPTWDGSFN